MLSELQMKQYVKDGYIIVPDFLSLPEVEKLHSIATADDVMLLREVSSLSDGAAFLEKEKDQALK